MNLTVGSLFSGIGGGSLGLERAGMRLIWVSEIDPYASAVLKKHHPEIPNHGDICAIDPNTIERPNVLCGGFPCQDISLAGKGAGLAGARSGLWYEYRRLIYAFRPEYAVIENVSALRARGLDAVLWSLAEIGYDAEWHCVPAAAVGAPHRRDRVLLVAYPVADSDGPRLEGWIRAGLQECAGQWAARESGTPAPAGSPADQWFVEPDVRRVADGIPSRVDRLRCLGNSFVPQVSEIVGRAIVADHASRARCW